MILNFILSLFLLVVGAFVVFGLATWVITLYIENARLLSKYYVGRKPNGQYFVYGSILWVTAAPEGLNTPRRGPNGICGFDYKLFGDEEAASNAITAYIHTQSRTEACHENNPAIVTDVVLAAAKAKKD